MARLKNVSGGELVLFARPGGAEAFAVDNGHTVDVPGEVTAQLGDAVVIGAGDDARAWPTALWQVVAPEASDVDAPQVTGRGAKAQEKKDDDRAAEAVATSSGVGAAEGE